MAGILGEKAPWDTDTRRQRFEEKSRKPRSVES